MGDSNDIRTRYSPDLRICSRMKSVKLLSLLLQLILLSLFDALIIHSSIKLHKITNLNFNVSSANDGNYFDETNCHVIYVLKSWQYKNMNRIWIRNGWNNNINLFQKLLRKNIKGDKINRSIIKKHFLCREFCRKKRNKISIAMFKTL